MTKAPDILKPMEIDAKKIAPVKRRGFRRRRLGKFKLVCGLRELHIEMGMFDYAVNVVIGDFKHLGKYVRFKHDRPDFKDSYLDGDGYIPRGRHIWKKGYCPIVWISNFPRSPREYGTLAHETIHAVSGMMDWADIRICDDTEEVLTHAVGFIVKSVLEARRK